MEAKYRIVTADRWIKFAGTGQDSWFTLEDARKLVNYEACEMIYQSNGIELLWEVF